MWIKATGLLATFVASAGWAQENAPAGLLRGDLQAWNGTPRGGEFTFRAVPGILYSCSYDAKTYFELDHRSITIAGAQTGDHLEIVSDQKPGSGLCYARTVHILDPPRAYLVPGVRPHPKAPSVPALLLTPHSELSVSGSVLQVTRDSLWLRFRSGEHKLIRLRPDTRFLSEGQPSDASSLPVNTLVFVRGARDLDNGFEACQVIWGGIFQPAH
jgi:hypothetical protein